MASWPFLWLLAPSCVPAPPGTTADDDDDTAASPIVVDTEGSDDRVAAGPTVLCAHPELRTAEGPFVRTVIGEDWARDPAFRGRGVTVDDWDGDGLLDLFVPQSGDTSHWFRGDGLGGFAEIALPVPLDDATAATSADLDGDGDPDLVVIGVAGPPLLLRNDGAGGFAAEPLPTDALGCGGTASVADMDLDGDLDLFHGRLTTEEEGPGAEPCGSRLFENTGAGGFVDVSSRLPASVGNLRVMASGFVELDADPWPELYLVTDMPERFDGNQVLDGDGLTFAERTGTGLEVDLAGMGLGLGDLNEDGAWDLVVPGIDEIAVLVSSPDLGLWIDQADAWSVVPARAEGQSWAWAGDVEDLDNDGHLDIAMSYGGPPLGASPPQEPDEVYRGLTEGGFERVGQAWGMADDWSARGVVLADLDGNGWLDLVKRELGGRVGVYVARCGAEHWLSVSLVGPEGNPDAIGATVVVEAGGRRLMRAITAGSTGYAASGPPVAHFGLGVINHVDAIEVTWPGGETTHHPGQDADRSIVVTDRPDVVVSD